MENQIPTKNEDFQIIDLINKYIRHWPWFVISVALCCGIGFVVIQSIPKTYQCTATVLIIEDNQPELLAGLADYQKFKANVNNEIDKFMSQQLIQEVVSRLNLNINYAVKEWLTNIDMYTQSPIVAVFPDSYEQDGFSFQVDIQPDSVVILSNLTQWGIAFSQNIVTKLNKPTQSPIGNIVISPTLYYSPDQFFKPIVVSKNSVKNVSKGFAGALNVSLLSKEKTVIVLNMEDVSYQRAEDFLNTLIVIYNENDLKEKNKTVEATLKQIDEKLPIVEEQLRQLDGLFASYKSANRVTDTKDAASLYLKESSENTGKIIELNNQINIARSIQTQINDNSKTSEMLPVNNGLNDPAIETSITEYNTLLLKRNTLIANGGGKNPVIEDLNNNLNSIRLAIRHNVDNLIGSLRIRLSSYRTQENKLTAEITSNPVQEKDLRWIERELNIKEQYYLYLLQQREENEMARIIASSNSRVINQPSGSMAPVKPSKSKIMLTAFIIGMGIPFVFIIGRNELISAIRNKNDIAHLPVPALGIIPHVNKREIKKKFLFVKEQGMDALNESFRIARTNLEFACMQNMKVIQFTSMESGSGKTFMALNLAMSLALGGKKVVLLDLDMRTAALSRLIEYQDMGISIALNKMVTAERFHIEKGYFHPNFDIIPAGPVPVNPSDLLTSRHLKMLIGNLKGIYDYVLMDVAHIGTFADASIIGQFADLSVVILRENYTNRHKLIELTNIFHGGKFKSMCVILNDSYSL